jgi:hypothetical protein
MCRLKSFLQNYNKEIVSMSSASVNTRFPRMAGVLLISSTLVALIYRFFIVTAILGDVNSSAVLSGYQRGMLNLGVVFAAIIVSAGLGALLAFLRGTSAYRLALTGMVCSVVAVLLITLSFFLNVFSSGEDLVLVPVYILLTGVSFILFDVALIRNGWLKWTSVTSIVLSVLFVAILLLGIHLLFFFYIAVLPVSIGLLILRQQRTVAPSVQREKSPKAHPVA